MSEGVLNGQLINDAANLCNWSDNQITDLLDAISDAAQGTQANDGQGYQWHTIVQDGQNVNMVYNNGNPMCDGNGFDPQSGAGALIVDRLMAELSNLESIAANSVATSQRIQKEINSKLS